MVEYESTNLFDRISALTSMRSHLTIDNLIRKIFQVIGNSELASDNYLIANFFFRHALVRDPLNNEILSNLTKSLTYQQNCSGFMAIGTAYEYRAHHSEGLKVQTDLVKAGIAFDQAVSIEPGFQSYYVRAVFALNASHLVENSKKEYLDQAIIDLNQAIALSESKGPEIKARRQRIKAYIARYETSHHHGKEDLINAREDIKAISDSYTADPAFFELAIELFRLYETEATDDELNFIKLDILNATATLQFLRKPIPTALRLMLRNAPIIGYNYSE